MKNYIIGAIGVFGLLLLCHSSVRADDGIKEGKWEMTTSLNMQADAGAAGNNVSVDYQNGQGETISSGTNSYHLTQEQMDAMKRVNPNFSNQISNLNMTTQNGKTSMNANGTMTVCVTNADPVSNIKDMAKRMQGCGEPQIQRNGGTIDYTVSCTTPHGQMDMTGHYVYTDDTMQGNASISAVTNGVASTHQTQITGKYIGPC